VIRVALACLLLSGCAPTLVWHGRGPDRARELRVEEVGDAQRLVLDGEVLGRWEAVGLEALAWTASGEPVYAVRDEAGWRVGVGRALGPAYEAVGVPAVAGDRVAYPALDEEGWRVGAVGVVSMACDQDLDCVSCAVEMGWDGRDDWGSWS